MPGLVGEARDACRYSLYCSTLPELRIGLASIVETLAGGDVLAVEPQPLVEGDHAGGLQILLRL